MPPESVYIPTPKVGEIVTFSYEMNSRRDMPINPKIYRVRTDVVWDDMVLSAAREKQSLGGIIIITLL